MSFTPNPWHPSDSKLNAPRPATMLWRRKILSLCKPANSHYTTELSRPWSRMSPATVNWPICGPNCRAADWRRALRNDVLFQYSWGKQRYIDVRRGSQNGCRNAKQCYHYKINVPLTAMNIALHKLTVSQLVKNAPLFKESKGSSPRSQQPADGPFLEPDESSTWNPVLFV